MVNGFVTRILMIRNFESEKDRLSLFIRYTRYMTGFVHFSELNLNDPFMGDLLYFKRNFVL